MRRKIALLITAMGMISVGLYAQAGSSNPYYNHDAHKSLNVSNTEWKKVLNPASYHILREQGTEAPNTGQYVNNHQKGKYYCMACGNLLFTSTTKFESGTGWPSFYQAAEQTSVKEITDNSHGMVRTEVACARCGGHLGHVFNDGPQPTGQRYCMNGNAMLFEGGK